MRKRGKDLAKLRTVVQLLASDSMLPAQLIDHPLAGPWSASRDCHIEPDWILIYTMGENSLRLERTGSHSDLFRKSGQR